MSAIAIPSTVVRNSKAIILFLCLCLLIRCTYSSNAQPTYLNHDCDMYYHGDDIDPSLGSALLSQLSSNSTNAFYKTNMGDITGLSFCWADVNVSRCQSCVVTATKKIQQLCPPTSPSVQISYDVCVLTYWHTMYTYEYPWSVLWYDVDDGSYLKSLEYYLEMKWLVDLIKSATGSSLMFATSQFNITATETRYGSVQCGREFNAQECNKCLTSLLDLVYDESSWWLLAENCSMRYGNSSFYKPDQELLPAPASVPNPYLGGRMEGYLNHECSESYDEPDQIDLSPLLSWLSSNSTNAFYKTNTGNISGLSFCWADVNVSHCQSCIATATEDIRLLCHHTTSFAQISYDVCIVAYWNRNYTYDLSFSPSSHLLYSESSRKLSGNYFHMKWVDGLIKSAMSSSLMFATSYFNDTATDQTWYGSVQCSRELGAKECNECLTPLLYKVADKQNWWVFDENCTIRYGNSSFYKPDEGLRPAADPAPIPVPNPDLGKNGGVSKFILTISISISAITIAILACCIYFLRMKRRKKDGPHPKPRSIIFFDHVQNEDALTLNEDVPTISLSTIQHSTNQFSEDFKLGEGGFGPVYKGILSDGRLIAVKMLSDNSGQGLEEFKNEVNFIAKLQHKNLVRLLGCCMEENKKLVVYEYMANASLDVHLFDKEKRKQLDWKTRLNIINGIARGIMYLHEGSRLRVIHRDLKAGNILLDNNMNPKISDFGLARIFKGYQRQANTQRVAGTYGYMAPEYAMEGLFSIKSDIFSFGVLLLEIISGKRNSESYLSEHDQRLLTYAWCLWNEGKSLMLMDPSLEMMRGTSEVIKCIHIGLLCVQEDAADRPTISKVIVMLGRDEMMLPTPTKPAFSVGRIAVQEFAPNNLKNRSINEVTISNVAPR